MPRMRFSAGGSWADQIHWGSDWDGHRQGELRGRREALLVLLRQRFGELPAVVVDTLRNSSSRHQMVCWTARAEDVGTLAEVFAEPFDGSADDEG